VLLQGDATNTTHSIGKLMSALAGAGSHSVRMLPEAVKKQGASHGVRVHPVCPQWPISLGSPIPRAAAEPYSTYCSTIIWPFMPLCPRPQE
jgi:hypothetical protein